MESKSIVDFGSSVLATKTSGSSLQNCVVDSTEDVESNFFIHLHNSFKKPTNKNSHMHQSKQKVPYKNASAKSSSQELRKILSETSLTSNTSKSNESIGRKKEKRDIITKMLWALSRAPSLESASQIWEILPPGIREACEKE